MEAQTQFPISLYEASQNALTELRKWAETYPEDRDLPRVITDLEAGINAEHTVSTMDVNQSELPTGFYSLLHDNKLYRYADKLLSEHLFSCNIREDIHELGLAYSRNTDDFLTVLEKRLADACCSYFRIIKQ